MCWGSLIANLGRMRKWANDGDVIAVMQAMATLRRATAIPSAYVDGLQDELLQLIGKPDSVPLTSVYLAFHGPEERATFVKVGVARNVKSRMRQLYTGSPMPRLWTFALALKSRDLAYKVEGALHAHLRDTGSSGEWFALHGLTHQAAEQFAASLAEVAEMASGRPAVFKQVEV